jgi:GNAT superfamily N-acetyltransferase
MWRPIAERLALYNEALAGRSGHHMPLVLVLRSNTDAIIGGLWSGISFSYLHIEMLFVPEALRNKGLGTQLLQLAERKAAERGCSGAWLQACSCGAPEFYEHRKALREYAKSWGLFVGSLKPCGRGWQG